MRIFHRFALDERGGIVVVTKTTTQWILDAIDSYYNHSSFPSVSEPLSSRAMDQPAIREVLLHPDTRKQIDTFTWEPKGCRTGVQAQTIWTQISMISADSPHQYGHPGMELGAHHSVECESLSLFHSERSLSA